MKKISIAILLVLFFATGNVFAQNLVELQIPDDNGEVGGRCGFFVSVGVWHQMQQEKEKAREAFNEAIKADKTCREAYLHLAQMLIQEGQQYQAETMLRRAAKNSPGDIQLHFRLSEIYLLEDKAVWAVRTLNKIKDALKGEQHKARWSYLMGLAAIGLEDWSGALKHLDEVSSDRRSGFAPYRYYRGVCLAALGRNMQARAQFDDFLQQKNTGEEFAKDAKLRLDQTYASGPKPPIFSIGLSLTPLYDSNVIQEPEDLELTKDSPAAFGLDLAIDMSLNLLRMPRHLLGADARVFRSFYFSDTADDYNQTAFAGDPRYRFLFHGFGFDQQIEAGYSFRLSLLDGGPLVDEEDMYVYSESHAGWAKWLIKESDFGETFLRLSFGRYIFRHLARNNYGTQFRAGQSFFFLDSRLKVFAELGARFEDAERQDYDRWAIGPFAGLSGLLPWELGGALWLQYEYLDHYDSDDSPSFKEHRKDHALGLGASLSRTFLDWLDLGMSYKYSRNISSVDLYDYQRHIISLTVGGRYAW